MVCFSQVIPGDVLFYSSHLQFSHFFLQTFQEQRSQVKEAIAWVRFVSGDILCTLPCMEFLACSIWPVGKCIMYGYKTKHSRFGLNGPFRQECRQCKKKRRARAKSWHLLENCIMQPCCPAESRENFIYNLVAVFSRETSCYIELYFA